MTIHLSTALIFFLHGRHFHHSRNVISQWVTGTAVQTPSVMYCGATIQKLESPLCGKNLHSNHWVWNWFYLSGIRTISSGFPLPVKCSFYNLGAQGMLIAYDKGHICVFLWRKYPRPQPHLGQLKVAPMALSHQSPWTGSNSPSNLPISISSPWHWAGLGCVRPREEAEKTKRSTHTDGVGGWGGLKSSQFPFGSYLLMSSFIKRFISVNTEPQCRINSNVFIWPLQRLAVSVENP